MRSVAPSLALVLLAAFHSVAGAQSVVVDEGTFMVSRNGTPLGRESFRIVRVPAPGGQVYRATGQSALGNNRLSTSLGTDTSGVPVSYESELSRAGEVVQRLQGRGRPGRFSVLVQTPTGESAREYVLDNGALLIEEGVFHHFYFVPIAASHKELIVISPRSTTQARFRVQQRGRDTVTVAGVAIPANHFSLLGPAGETHDVWADDAGRLLKVSIAEKGMIALRDDPPRQSQKSRP